MISFSAHENQAYPPGQNEKKSNFRFGRMFERADSFTKNTVVSPAEVVILGVAVNVNFLSPDNANTFSDYAS